jgi:hypothetical protein
MRLKTSSIALLILTWCISASAQTFETKLPSTLPGSAWDVTGNISPAEHGNVISAGYAEQGVTLFRGKTYSLVPYVSLGATLDTKGYDWNNRLTATGAVKLVKNFSHGIVSIGGGYANEYRFKSGMRKSAPVAQAVYWFGWQPNGRLPGSSWGVLGNISPVERNNLIATAYIQQGVRVAKIKHNSLVPFAETTLSKDTDENDWNNRHIYGAGLKVVVPGPSRVCELGASYQREHRFQSRISASGFSVFVKMWFGWNPKL